MKIVLVIILILSFLSCNDSQLDGKKSELQISNKGFEFKLFQRNQIEIPSYSNNVYCQIDDITEGQTILTISASGETILNASIESGEKINFEFNEGKYSIECTRMVNKLLGEDYAWFRIINRSIYFSELKDESKQIEELLMKIETSDVAFIRNGNNHSGKEAADHLRSKWKQTNGKIKSLDSFISNIASKSSSSGKPYLVQLKDGTVLSAEDWYRNNLLK